MRKLPVLDEILLKISQNGAKNGLSPAKRCSQAALLALFQARHDDRGPGGPINLCISRHACCSVGAFEGPKQSLESFLEPPKSFRAMDVAPRALQGEPWSLRRAPNGALVK